MAESDQPVATEPESQGRPWIGPAISWGTLAAVVLVSVIATIGRLLGLDRFPGGLLDTGAAHGLLARQAAEFGPRMAIESAGELSVPLVSAMALIGSLSDFDADTPRLAAALAGGGSILFTGLWLRREIGPFWGLAGTAVLAGSFWHILYSRIAAGPITAALALAAALWLLSLALSRRGRAAMPWYLLFGIAVGLGFLSTPALRLLPLVLLGALAVSLYQHWGDPDQSGVLNWLAASVAAVLTIGPWLVSNGHNLPLWTPWGATPGLPGEDRATLLTLPGAIIEGVTGLGLPADVGRALNLPVDPWFSLLMLPWAIIGLLGLISASNDPDLRGRFIGGVAGAVALLLGTTAVDAGHPGQYVAVSPLLAGVVVYGFRTALEWARMPTVRVALALLIVFGLTAEAYFSWYQYRNDWAREPETSAEFNVGLVDALVETAELPPGEPVFVNVTGQDDLLDYFVSPGRRHAFDGARWLPFPAGENGFLATPHAAPISMALEQLLAEAPLVNDGSDERRFELYRLDDRIRAQMPLGIPTYPYPDGAALYGGRIAGIGNGAASVVVAWNVPAGSGPHEVDVRLGGVEAGAPEAQETVILPGNPLTSRLFQVVVAEIELPDSADQVDLSVRLRDERGEVLRTGGGDEDGFIMISRYQLPE